MEGTCRLERVRNSRVRSNAFRAFRRLGLTRTKLDSRFDSSLISATFSHVEEWGSYRLLDDTLPQQREYSSIQGTRDPVMSMQLGNSDSLSVLAGSKSPPFHVQISNYNNCLPSQTP